MSIWDILTAIMVVTLAGSAVAIFVLFMKDIRGVLEGSRKETDRSESPPAESDPP